jgi:hypothetical protein
MLRFGVPLYAVAMAGLGASGLVAGEPLPAFQTGPLAWPPAVLLADAALLLSSLCVLFGWQRRHAAKVLLLFWIASFLVAGWALLAAPADIGPWVAAAESAVFAHAALAIATGDPEAGSPWGGRRLGITFGTTLLIFGAIHLIEHATITTLIPTWIPVRNLWPFLTGLLQVAAGAALLGKVLVRPASLIIAAMFAAWLPIVHAGRIVASPNLFEWSFALTALALVAVALMVQNSPRADAGPGALAD